MSEDAEQTLLQAANARRAKEVLGKLTPAGLRSLTRQVGPERRNKTYTPWSWADEAGVYFGEDDAWLYYRLPVSVLTAGTPTFQRLLDAMAQRLGERAVHLLTYQWEEAATIPEGLAENHRDYLRSSLRLLVPGQVFVVGIQLQEDSESLKDRATVRSVFSETIELALGEWVPDLGRYSRDAALIVGLLSQFGGQPVSAGAQDMLEAWYSLGVSKELDAEETDDAIVIRGAETVEMVSVRSFAEAAPANPSAAPSPGSGGTLAISARGILQLTKTDVHGTAAAGMLHRVSLVMGRHSAVLTGTLSDACSAMVGVGFKPLPMRQIPALLETLPCSPEVVDPNLFRVDAGKLARAGFSEPIPAGDRTGLLVGMVEPNFSYPLYLDLFSKPAYGLVIAGSVETDKELLVEHLAAQARMARRKVLFLNRHTDYGKGLAETDEAPRVWEAAIPGMLDPFHHLGPDLGPYAFMHVLRHALPDLDAATLATLERQLARAAVAKITTATRAIRLLSDAAHAAALVRFSKTPAGRLLFLPDDTELPHESCTRWDARTLLAGVTDPNLATVVGDLLLAVAHVRSRGGMLITDSGRWAPGTITHAVVGNLGSSAGAIVVTTNDARDLGGTDLPPAATTVILAHDGDQPRAYFESQGVKNAEVLCEWLHGAGAQVDIGVIVSPDRGFIFDDRGNKAAFLVGPVPRERLIGYTRGEAFAYAMDATSAPS